MPSHPTFQERYKQEITPWETHRVDRALVQFIKQTKLAPCTVLDAGCGTGNNGIWLAKQGFAVTGWDFVIKAIVAAKTKAEQAGVTCSFEQTDMFNLPPNPGTFDFIFDRGLFHCCKSSNQLDDFVEIIAKLLRQNGIWLSLIGNADETRSGDGPPQLTATQITRLTEPLFYIESLTASFFDSDQQPPPKNWICQMRKR